MIFWYETDSGKIRQASQGVITPTHHGIFPEGSGVAVIELDADASAIDTHYISNGVLIEKPTRPSGWHYFDYATKQWEDPRGVKELQAEYLAAVEKEKLARKTAPIFYEGHLVDAHTTAQTNITNKLNELNAIEALGLSAESIDLYWRVADNSSVEFDSLASMKAWLLGLVAAISRRTTEIYSWSWVQKEKIRSSTSKEELEALGWLK